jgi:predicted esterase
MIKKILKIAGILVVIILSAFLFDVFKAPKKPVKPAIDYIQILPEIDGFLDESLKSLPVRKLPKKIDLYLFKNIHRPNYRLAYNADYLYLYLETEADTLICRDRGYQNGDGFIFLLADGSSGKKFTDKFYVYGFSSQVIEEQKWAEKIIWYKDNITELRRLPDDVKIRYAAHEGKISFELLLPWYTAYPFHPRRDMVIGTNLWFLEALEGKSIPVVNAMFWDFKLPSESEGRKYKVLEFKKPEVTKIKSYWMPERNNYFEKDILKVNFFNPSETADTGTVGIKITDKDNLLVFLNNYSLKFNNKTKTNYIEFQLPEIDPGTYNLTMEAENLCYVPAQFTVLPEVNINQIKTALESIENKITQGDYNTISFYISEMENKLGSLQPDYLYSDLIDEISFLKNTVSDYLQNRHSLLSIKDIHRRAFVSNIDSTPRPYSVILPVNFDSSKTYPLLVFLHGSGKTDTEFGHHNYIFQDDFICIAPNGRGISNYYGTPESQKDINEAVDDIIKNFRVDTNNIILSGFSMGGYGVYRTFIDNPGRYKALAVIAGEPKVNMFLRLGKGSYPNFLKERNLKLFRDIPIFIYHGVNDLNCPYPSTRKLIEKLEAMDANLTKMIYTGYGHSTPAGDEFANRLREWIILNTTN